MSDRNQTSAADKERADLTAKRDEECLPVAASIINIISKGVSEGRLIMGAHAADEIHASAKAFFVSDIEPLLRAANIKIFDLNYIFQLALAPIDNVKMVSIDSTTDAMDAAIETKLGKTQDSLRISDIIEIQKTVDNSPSKKSAE